MTSPPHLPRNPTTTEPSSPRDVSTVTMSSEISSVLTNRFVINLQDRSAASVVGQRHDDGCARGMELRDDRRSRVASAAQEPGAELQRVKKQFHIVKEQTPRGPMCRGRRSCVPCRVRHGSRAATRAAAWKRCPLQRARADTDLRPRSPMRDCGRKSAGWPLVAF